MRIAFISDIHANIEALEAVLAEAERAAVDEVVCLGDVVGYNAEPDGCVARLRGAGVRTIAGNHDQAASGVIEPTQFGEKGRRSINWTRKHASAECLAYLRELPVFLRLPDGACAVHAALHPEPNTRYHLNRPERIEQSFAKLEADGENARICFFGHTHRPVVWEQNAAGTRQRVESTPSEVHLREDSLYLINPGTVGQPREADRRASFVVWDSRAASVSFRRVEYDWESNRRRSEAAGLLGEVPLTERSWMYLTNQLDTGWELAQRALRRGQRILGRAATR